ncbi:hypothetical protein L596_011394 [Steinernema carpocapsae]|uniref:Major facilitator superfamily (MFS) profile domain-containing protein n=1 Tax=Steinernema carpocapsae TaxID=34508 RepID=A0A4U5NUN0_STECR|nr:hypothetical protein L596_011394 [Steinernema carpocapsae]
MEDAEEIKEAVKAPKSNLGAFQNFGWYTGLICLVQEFLVLSQLSNMTFMIYGGYSPTVVSCGSTVFTGSDSERCLQLTVARNESDCEPQLEAQFGSVNYEFDLVCQDRILVKNSISIQMFGAMVGALVFGQVSDLFGRKKALMICLVGMLLFSMVSSCVGSLFAFTASRFFVMMFTGGLNSIQSVYIMENVPKKHRVWIPITISYSPNYIVFSIIAYFCGDWRSLTRVSSLVGNVPAILLLCFVHESPRWFVQKGRLEDARRTLIAIDAFNGTHTKKRLAEMEEGLEKEKMIFETQRRKKRYSFIHLFYTWKLTGYIFTLSFALMSASIINYALMFNMDKLSGSIYLNSVFFGFIRYAMNIFTAVFDYFGGHRSGRKVVHNGAMGVTATSLLFIFIVLLFGTSEETAWVTRIATLCACAMCSQLFLVSGIATTELFPTAVRNLAVSFTAILNRIGSILSPHLFTTALLWKPLPYAILLTIIVIELTSFNLFIPETKGTHMVDHMPGPEERIFAKKKKSSVVEELLQKA